MLAKMIRQVAEEGASRPAGFVQSGMAVGCVNIDGRFYFLPVPAISPGEVEIRKTFGNTASVSREFHDHSRPTCSMYFAFLYD